jgi:hypothetical protein
VAGQPTGREFLDIASDPDAFEQFYRRHVEAVQHHHAQGQPSTPIDHAPAQNPAQNQPFQAPTAGSW